MSRGARFFFIHVMKTGGGSFARNLRANFADYETYPSRQEPRPRQAYTRISRLLELPAERRAEIRAYTGHFPFVASELLCSLGEQELVTMTLLRDPVERTLSHLRQRQHHHGEGMSLEELYDDLRLRVMIFVNFQVKQFAMRPSDAPVSYLDGVEVDDARLELAKTNLQRVDVVGLQHRSNEMLAEMVNRFGWRTRYVHERHGIPPASDAPVALRRRIAHDNAADLEFYRYAKELVATRGGAGSGAPK